MAIDAADVATVGRPGLPQGEPGLAELRIAAEVGDEKAMQAIAVQQSPEAWSMLMDLAVSNVDEQIRRDAIKKLGSFRTPGDIAPLYDLLVYSEFGVTDDCANVLRAVRLYGAATDQPRFCVDQWRARRTRSAERGSGS